MSFYPSYDDPNVLGKKYTLWILHDEILRCAVSAQSSSNEYLIQTGNMFRCSQNHHQAFLHLGYLEALNQAFLYDELTSTSIISRPDGGAVSTETFCLL
jgi:hypothetical protein